MVFIGLENSRHFLIQSEVKPKPTVTRSQAFSRALHVSYMHLFDWFTGLCVSFVIGQSDYFVLVLVLGHSIGDCPKLMQTRLLVRKVCFHRYQVHLLFVLFRRNGIKQPFYEMVSQIKVISKACLPQMAVCVLFSWVSRRNVTNLINAIHFFLRVTSDRSSYVKKKNEFRPSLNCLSFLTWTFVDIACVAIQSSFCVP